MLPEHSAEKASRLAEWPIPREAADPALQDRQAAARELGEAMRALSEAVVRTEVGPGEVRAAARSVEAVTAALAREQRGVRQVATIDDLGGGVRLFSSVTGEGSPFAPPLRRGIRPDGALEARGTFGARFEGPPGLVHGGVIALAFDEILGWEAARVRAHGLTATLEVSYRRGVPLGEDVVILARVVRQEGRKVWAQGTLALGAEEDRVLASAQALFIRPRDQLRHEYFDALTNAAGDRILDSDEWEAPTA